MNPSLLPLASTRDTIADYVSALFIVYFVLIFVRILLTWIPRMPYNRYLRAVVGFIEEVTDPYLNVFRRFIRPIGGGGFALDLSPMLAMLLLYIVGLIVVSAIRG
jgi:YggT family protein